MKAAVMRAVGEPLTIEDIELSDPGPDEVLIRVAAAGLCRSDLHFLEGDYGQPLPAVLGHESAGVVTQVGTEVTSAAPGDHVITFLAFSCGACVYCLEGHPQLCEDREATQRGETEPPRLTAGGEPVHQFLHLASFADHMLVHENAVVKIREDMPLGRASLLGCGVATGLGAVLKTADVEEGQTVAVIGCGGVGLAAVQGARIAGAATIIAIDRIDEKLELAISLGATHTVNASSGDPVSQVLAMTGGHGVHHSLEAFGSKATAEMAFAMLRRGGTATIIGLILGGTEVSVPGFELFNEKKLQGSNMGSSKFRSDIPEYIDMYFDGRLNLDDMVTARISLEQINEGFEVMKAGRAARNIVVFD